VSFAVDAEAYDRFMGRYSSPLATAFCAFVDVAPGQRVLDVGCGPGAFVAELVERVGASSVTAVEPSPTFVAAVRSRFPGVDVRAASAEDLPFGDDTFDLACAQLVVHFMDDPSRGVAEMARVARPGGSVATCVWDFVGGRAPVSPFWEAAATVLGEIEDESALAGAGQGQLTSLLASAGLLDLEETALQISVRHETFDEWWEPFTLGVGPAGAAAASLGGDELDAIRQRCRELLGDGPFTLEAAAWAARGRVGARAI
jgi:SAM-dependent methyltransferase